MLEDKILSQTENLAKFQKNSPLKVNQYLRLDLFQISVQFQSASQTKHASCFMIGKQKEGESN